MKILRNERPKPKWAVAWNCDARPGDRMGQPAKIGRLPRGVREELNYRLQQRESSARLAKWLNGLPETQSASSGNFRYGKITVADLADWKMGGFRDWQIQQERRRNFARHCLAWARRPEMQDKLFGRRPSWLEIRNHVRRIFGKEPFEREDLPADQDWDAIPTPKQRRIAAYAMMGLTPKGQSQSETMGYFGPPQHRPASKSTLKQKRK
jgi:hypothetical protein